MRFLGLGIAAAVASAPAMAEAQTERVIFIKTLTGRTYEVPYDIRNTVLDVKQQIETNEKISKDRQQLIFAGKLLEDNRLILDYRILAG